MSTEPTRGIPVKISDEAIPGLEVPTGNPLLVELTDALEPVSARYLDEERAGPLPDLP